MHVVAGLTENYCQRLQASLYTRGPPIRGKLFRLNRADTEWIEKAIEEDVKRGRLEKENSDWGFPAFPTKKNP
eukprot:12098366-Karenia_brevis.AAC.1